MSGVLAPYILVNVIDNGNPFMYVAGNITGLLISPDLDVDKGNISDSIIRKVSRPAQWIWRKFWTPYSLALPHRSTLSHFPVLSTLVRLGYIVVGLNLFLMVGWAGKLGRLGRIDGLVECQVFLELVSTLVTAVCIFHSKLQRYTEYTKNTDHKITHKNKFLRHESTKAQILAKAIIISTMLYIIFPFFPE